MQANMDQFSLWEQQLEDLMGKLSELKSQRLAQYEEQATYY